MQRRIFSREYKLEAVKLVRERGVTVAQAARDLDVHENVLRKWVREYGDDPRQSFPGKGQMKPEQLEIERLRREVAKLKAERDILKRPQPTLAGTRYEVRVHCKAPPDHPLTERAGWVERQPRHLFRSLKITGGLSKTAVRVTG